MSLFLNSQTTTIDFDEALYLVNGKTMTLKYIIHDLTIQVLLLKAVSTCGC